MPMKPIYYDITQQAAKDGLGWIVQERTEYAGHWIVRDMLTNAIFSRPFCCCENCTKERNASRYKAATAGAA